MHNEHEASSNCTYLVRQKWRDARNIFGVWTFPKKKISLEGHVIQGEMYSFSVQNYNDNMIVLAEFRTGNDLRQEKIFHKVN